MKSGPIFAAILVAATAPEGPPLLPLDRTLFAEDVCLAPAFASAGCPAPTSGSNQGLTASAALLAPELQPVPEPRLLLSVEAEVLRAGAEVTFGS